MSNFSSFGISNILFQQGTQNNIWLNFTDAFATDSPYCPIVSYEITQMWNVPDDRLIDKHWYSSIATIDSNAIFRIRKYSDILKNTSISIRACNEASICSDSPIMVNFEITKNPVVFSVSKTGESTLENS